jgi:hypothetical protein
MKAAHRAFLSLIRPQPPSPTRYTSFTALLRRLLPDYHRSNPVTCISRFLIHLILHLLASHDPPVSVPRLPGRTSQQRLQPPLTTTKQCRRKTGESPFQYLFPECCTIPIQSPVCHVLTSPPLPHRFCSLGFLRVLRLRKKQVPLKNPSTSVQSVNGQSNTIRYGLRQFGVSKEIGEGCQPRTSSVVECRSIGSAVGPPQGSVCLGTIVALALPGRCR